ncbi:MAG: P-loop NTPase fold protein [Bacteroidota bacterium]
MTKLLSNIRIEQLSRDTDYLGIIDKGNLIKSFLIGTKDSFDEIKMFSLYGDWGSGKSSLMKFLQNELSEDFNTFFFEAWEYEKDENLAMSIIEFITQESNSVSEEFYDDVLKYGGRLLRGLGKSVKLNIPLFTNGPSIELNPSAFVEELAKSEEISFYEALKKFKQDFIRLEDFITRGNNPKYNIIFIDDLDRCEPQQVLNLMSAIKLFFTYGKKTIFFCGIDKSAVEAAVKTKYGKIVKSNEYLEKIFDISFSMPEHYDLQKLIDHYFDKRTYSVGQEHTPINSRIHDFFYELNFLNPRRVKKVLNKYQMFRSFKSIGNNIEVFPSIDMKNNSEKSFFETILVLYLIILHEFFPTDFEDFLNFDKKKKVYSAALEDATNYISELRHAITNNYSKKKFSEMNTSNNQTRKSFWICLSPLNVEKINLNALLHQSSEQITVSKNHIDFLFYKYINNYHIEDLLDGRHRSNCTLFTIKKIIKDLL